MTLEERRNQAHSLYHQTMKGLAEEERLSLEALLPEVEAKAKEAFGDRLQEVALESCDYSDEEDGYCWQLRVKINLYTPEQGTEDYKVMSSWGYGSKVFPWWWPAYLDTPEYLAKQEAQRALWLECPCGQSRMWSPEYRECGHLRGALTPAEEVVYAERIAACEALWPSVAHLFEDDRARFKAMLATYTQVENP